MDVEELDKHLAGTCDMIRRHRGRMISGAVGYQDIVVFQGFGPSSPVNEDAMEMADLEAAFVGNLARYCMAMGTVSRIPLKGFWWVNGECKGMKCAMIEDEFDLMGNHNGKDVLAPIRRVVKHLRVHVGAILATEGVGPILDAGAHTRWYSLKMFPQEDDEWLTEAQAIDHTGRTREALYYWRKSGSVSFIKDEKGISYKKSDLDLRMEIVRGNMLRRNQSINSRR